jgi:hypothetical protein
MVWPGQGETACGNRGDGYMIVWMAVTADKYELPVYIADTAAELARIVGISYAAIRSYVYRRQKGHGYKYIKVEI